MAGLVLLALLTAWGVHAQTAPAPPSFEVASIKPSGPDAQGMYLLPQSGGDLRLIGATLKNLIAYAYNVREFGVSGGPGWVNSDRFDINARARRPSAAEDPSGGPRQIGARLKSLLAERFQLVIHSETKEQNVYALVPAKSGPKVSEAKAESGSTIRRRQGSIIGQGVGMRMLVLNLANAVERPVLDRTGLTGRYDYKLEWSPDVRGSGSIAAAGGEAPLPPDPNGPSLFTALQEQMGLRLEPQKAPVEILVIDHAARPSEN